MPQETTGLATATTGNPVESAATPTPESRDAHTKYVVLALTKQSTDPSTYTGTESIKGIWEQVGSFAARTSEAAIRAYAEKTASTGPLVLVAVPARSWQPVKVTPKVATTLEIEAVS